MKKSRELAILLEKVTGGQKFVTETVYTIEEGEGEMSQEDVELLKVFVDYCLDRLEVTDVPVIELLIKRKDGITSGGYDINDNMVFAYVKNRHILDICRSIAHELKHAEQVENDRLDVDGEDSATCPSEIEATVFAAKTMREFLKEHPETYRE